MISQERSMFLVPFATAAWAPSDRARDLAEDVRAAILECGLDLSHAADLMGIPLSVLSEGLACRKPLNVFRLTCLPPAFHDAWDARRAARRGALFLCADLVTILRGAGRVGRMRMAKISAETRTRKLG
jgi:hypothetical protein